MCPLLLVLLLLVLLLLVLPLLSLPPPLLALLRLPLLTAGFNSARWRLPVAG
jgi:hypothetical protein